MNNKKSLQYRLEAVFAGMAVWCAERPFITLAIAGLLAASGVWGASMARQDNSLDAYFLEDDVSFQFYKNYIDEFSSDEVTYLLYAVPEKEHGPFDLDAMKTIGQLTETLEREVPFVRKVTSLANVEFIEARGDEIEIHALMSNFPEDQEEMLRMRDVALSKPLYVNSIVSEDGQYAAIVVEMTRNSTDKIDRLRLDPEAGDGLDNLYPQASNNVVQEILKRPEYQDIQFWVSGDVPMNSAYNVLIGEDIGIVTLLTFTLVGIASLIFLGPSLMGLLAPLLVVLLSLIMTLGFIGLTGLKINLFFLMIPTLLCAIGVAQCMHILLTWQHERSKAPSRMEAIRKTVLVMGVPCFLIVITDAMGFFGMAISELKALSEMAWYSAFGVLMTFVFAMTLMFALASFSKKPKGVAKPTAAVLYLRKSMEGLSEFNIRHWRAILVIGLVAAAGVLGGLSRLKVDFNFLEEFKPSVEWRQHTQTINNIMGGILSVVYVFDAEQSDGVKNVELLRNIETLQGLAEKHPVVQDTVSVADIVKELNQAFNGGASEFYRLPDDRQTLAQLLLVYELSGGKEMNDVLNLDRSKTALQVRLQLVSAIQVREFIDAMDTHIQQHPVDGIRVEVSGVGLLWVRMAEYISETQIKAYAITFVVIGLFMVMAFGSIRLGALAMIPNLFPIALTLGLMGWLGWHLDYMRLLLATIAIGIAVDDTIHFVASFRRAFDACGRYEDALRRTLPEIGPAMVATTAILLIAFSSYHASSLAVVASFGVLLSFTIGMALVADLLLMPALILWLKPLGPERSGEPEVDNNLGADLLRPEANG